jgi:hypothetical protein
MRAEARADANNEKTITIDMMIRDMVTSEEPIAPRLVACRPNVVHDAEPSQVPDA